MTEPNLVSAELKPRFIPELRPGWWTVLLVTSLMVNLLIGGAILGAKFRSGPGPFALLENRPQLLPRRFFAELPRERRRELIAVINAKRDQLLQNRTLANGISLKFADTLEMQEFDAAALKSNAEEFVSSYTQAGSNLIVELVSKLTPEERNKLAKMIRERSANFPIK